MTTLNVSNFDYPPRGFIYPSSACNSTWTDVLQAKPLDLSYPPNDPAQAQVLYIAGLICRYSDNSKISNLAWHVYSTLTAFGCMLTARPLQYTTELELAEQIDPLSDSVFSLWSSCMFPNSSMPSMLMISRATKLTLLHLAWLAADPHPSLGHDTCHRRCWARDLWLGQSRARKLRSRFLVSCG